MFSLLSLLKIAFLCLKTDPARNANARSFLVFRVARSTSPPIRVMPVPSARDASVEKQRRTLGFPD